MDKKKKKTALPPRLEREEQNERTEDRKKMRKTKVAEQEASSNSTKSELQQQQTRQEELTESDQSEGDIRMKLGFGAKRTKKPPKSLENFICRPTVRVSQRPTHGDGYGSCGVEASSSQITGANKSHRETQKKDSKGCVSSKASTSSNLSTPLPTSSKKADSTPVNTPTKNATSKQSRKRDSKSLLTSDGPSYAFQPQTDSKVPLSDRITSSTPLKQTHSPPAAPSPPSTLQQNSSPQDGTQVLNVHREKGEDLPPGATMTASLSSKDMTLKAQKSSSSLENDSECTLFPISCSEDLLPLKQSCPPKETFKIRESNVENVLNVNGKEDGKHDGNSAGSKNTYSTVNNKKSKENDLAHQPSSSIKTPSLLPALDKYAVSSTPENSTCTPELPERRRRNKKHNESGDIYETRKMAMEPAQTIPTDVQPKDCSKVGHIIDKNKKRNRHCSNQEEKQCSSQTTSCADSQFKTDILFTDKSSSDEPLQPKQNTNPPKKQKVVQITKMADQMEKMDLVKTTNVSSTACKTESQTFKLKKIPSMKSSKALSSPQCKPGTVGRTPKSKQLQNPSLRSEISALEPQPKKRGRPKMIRLDESLQGCKSHKIPIREHSHVPDPEVDMQLPKPMQRKRGCPKHSFSVQPQSSVSQDTAYMKKVAEDNLKPSLFKAKDTPMSSKRNRLIMKTIIKNINKMKVKKKDQVLTQFLSGQKQCRKANFAQKDNDGDADGSVSDATHSLSSLVSSFGGKLGPQINVSKHGTIYIGKRRGRKPKSQRENSCQASEQILLQKPQKMAESSNKLNSWSTPGEQIHSFDSQPAVSSSPNSFKHLKSSSTTIGSFRKKLYPGNCEYGQHSAPKVTCSQRGKGMPEEKSKSHSSLQSTPLPLATTQLGSVRMQDCRTAHLARSILMEQELLKHKCHRKGHNCLSHEKIRRHKHKCKRKCLQLRAKRQDPAFLAEIEDLVVRLSEIRIVHHIAQGGNEAKTGGSKSMKGKGHPHFLQCLPQNLHHPAMFQINFSGYYSPQSDFSRDSLHYVGMADFKRNNRCPSEPSEHIVTHCPVVHKLGFPLSGAGCYYPPYKMPLSTTSFGFGLYRGYPPSATIYPSSPFLASYVHPYSKTAILSPTKFHKRKHKYLRRDSVFCGGKAEGTYSNVTSHPSSDWFSRNSWQREDNREQGRDKRLVDDSLSTGREREGIECLLGQSRLRKDHLNRRASSSNSPCSFSMLTKKADKHKTSLPSYIGPAHLRTIPKVRWAEHQQPWRWRESVPLEQSNSNLNQEAESGYQEEEDTIEGPESDEDLPSPPLLKRTVHHHTFLKKPNLTSSAYSRQTVQRGTGEVRCTSKDLRRPGRTLIKEPCSAGDKRASESFQPGSQLFPVHHQHGSHSFTEGQERAGKKTRHNKSQTLLQKSLVTPFAPSTAPHNSLSHSDCAKQITHTKGKLKQVNKPEPKVKRRGPGRPRKNPAPCFSPSLSAAPLHHRVTECPEKQRKGKRGEKRKGKKRKDGGHVDGGEDVAESQEPSDSHFGPSSPYQDPSVSVHNQSERSSTIPPDKKYEWAGLYSDVYKSAETFNKECDKSSVSLSNVPHSPPSLSPPVNTECLLYDPEEHEHGLFPAPIHVGKYLRLKRIDFQLPYDIYWLCAHKKVHKILHAPLRTATSNGSVGVMSLTQTEDSPCTHHKDSVPQDCIADSLNRNDSCRLPSEEVGEEISQSDLDNNIPQHSDPLKQQERGSDAENIPSPLLMMPLSCEERSFILEHGIFLVRNYEKIRERQALLLREGVREQEKENKKDGGRSQSHKGVLGVNTSTKSGHNSGPAPKTTSNLFPLISQKGKGGHVVNG
ncbi:histone-lysine N-methyltransferase ASH1L-like isoform X3 [Myxocyprinus asiaticus]|uniref:histone-lysine N-methyltransferase ASH1L-like isoform X3 n=1 Tax=Myxocyprinus asiaticus TaxID=70543 RepID=UPI002221B1A2|nr:histone-lysine N-methyltransferase ASH1L-like isoform X3 [Myxocyprinus asiaticus]XP_051574865.1 histone-lysine N-methyltransferase ASH1L-like isoform X3 [Myxocyprinus asiaticus]